MDRKLGCDAQFRKNLSSSESKAIREKASVITNQDRPRTRAALPVRLLHIKPDCRCDSLDVFEGELISNNGSPTISAKFNSVRHPSLQKKTKSNSTAERCEVQVTLNCIPGGSIVSRPRRSF